MEVATGCTVVDVDVVVVSVDPADPHEVATTRSATRHWMRALGLVLFITRVYTMTTAELRTFLRGNMSATLSDHDAIRQVAARYARGVDRLDGDLMKSAYWPEATDDHWVFVGNAMAFCDRVIDSHQRFTGTMHCVMNHAIEVNGSTASGEIYNVTYVFRTDNGVDTSTRGLGAISTNIKIAMVNGASLSASAYTRTPRASQLTLICLSTRQSFATAALTVALLPHWVISHDPQVREHRALAFQ